MYCKTCGAEMVNDAAFCTSCGAASGSGSAYCPNCGAQAIPGAAFCPQCGFQFAPAETPVSEANPAQAQPAATPFPQGYQQPPVAPQPVAPPKSKLAAGLLGILLGALGVHNFYLGYTSKAIIQLCLSLLSCGILSVVSGIWGLVEGILILTGSITVDGNGQPLGE